MKRMLAAAAIAGSTIAGASAFAAPVQPPAARSAVGVMLGANTLVLASSSLPGSPEEAALDLALEYIQNGGDSGKTAEQLKQDLVSLGADVAIGILDIGGAAFGVPGIGSAAESLFGIFGGSSGAPDKVQQELDLIKRRLDALELRVSELGESVDRLNIEAARNANADRTRLLHLIMNKHLRDSMHELRLVPEMTADAKEVYVEKIINTADLFLPTKKEGAALWSWHNVRVRANASTGVSTEPVVVRELNLALEPYLQTLAFLASAMRATGVSDRTIRNRMLVHAAFLAGDAQERGAYGLPFTLLDTEYPIDCRFSSTSSAQSRSGCTVTFTCSSPAASRSRTRELAQPSIRNACSWTPVPEPVVASAFAELRAEVQSQTTPTKELLQTAARVMTTGSASVATTPPPPPPFDNSPPGEIFNLYARGAQGMRTFTHTIRLIDTWKKTPKPAVDCSGPLAMGSEACNPVIAPKPKPKPGGTPIARGADPLPPAFARFESKHELSQPASVPGSWSAYRQVMPSHQVLDAGRNLFLYALQTDGLLKSIRVTRGALAEARNAGHGWGGFKRVFSGGEGVLYAVEQNGDLVWYRHTNWRSPSQTPLFERKVVGVGWGDFLHLFSAGRGVIYAVRPDGRLLWYRHDGFATGAGLGTAGSWRGPREIGVGWNVFGKLTAAPGGIIYGVDTSGKLLYYRHRGWETGVRDWESDNGVPLGDGWAGYADIFTPMAQPDTPIVVK